MTKGARKRVTVIPGDDAAPEAVHPALDILQSMGLPIHWDVLPDGADAPKGLDWTKTVRDAVDKSDTALLGATSGSTGALSYLRWGKDTYANLRPVRWIPGTQTPLGKPEGIDYVIVRENLEDIYVCMEGDLNALLGSGLTLESEPPKWFGAGAAYTIPLADSGRADGRYAVKIITKYHTERIAEFACQVALKRKELGHPGKVTCSSKYNVLWRSDEFFRRTVKDIVGRYSDLQYEEFIIDDLARRLVAQPQSFDVVVLPNLYGDILSDEAAATIGGLGMAPSGCYGTDFAYFEPVHGTAPDIVGRRIINPTATILSSVLMLDYLGFGDAAVALEKAIDATIAAGDNLTHDIGGHATSDEFAAAVKARLRMLG